MGSFTPTDEQKAAIDFDGNMVITACPGSGKTTVIQQKIKAAVQDVSDHKGVIAITFTKKASKDLEARCRENAQDMKQSFFGTIDSFCFKELILPFLSRLWGSDPRDCKVIKRLQPPFLYHLKENYCSPTIENVVDDEGFRKLYDEGILWMNSFAALALYILEASPSARRYIKARYTSVFIDEYQDSSVAQHKLFLKLLELDLAAVAVGDTAQSIYEFRGGNAELLNSLVSDTDSFRHFEININHRCHPSIVNYASRVLNPDFTLISCVEKFIYRKPVNGNLERAGVIISSWISDWIAKNEWGVSNASEIAVLAKQEKSLKLISSGLNVNYRIYTDTPLGEDGSECSDLYTHLLAFKFGAIPTVQELITDQFELIVLKHGKLPQLRKVVRELRVIEDVEQLIMKFHEVASFLGISVNDVSDQGVRTILGHEQLIKQFMPLVDDEVQLMTLHKSKGLEFKVVFHFDLEEWSLPYQRVENGDWDHPIYPSLKQDMNLHYVGITRAENCCILMSVSLRQNRSGGYSNASPSYFLKLPQLEGLYAQ